MISLELSEPSSLSDSLEAPNSAEVQKDRVKRLLRQASIPKQGSLKTKLLGGGKLIRKRKSKK